MEIASIQVAFEYGTGDNALDREIVRNCEMIMSTPKGSSPLFRDFGIETSMLDRPLDVAQNLFAVSVMEAIEKWEPRARVTRATLTPDKDGRINAKAVIVRAQ